MLCVGCGHEVGSAGRDDQRPPDHGAVPGRAARLPAPLHRPKLCLLRGAEVRLPAPAHLHTHPGAQADQGG